MPDILIRGMEMPKTCADCHDADLPTAIAWLCAKCPWAHGIIDPGVYDLRHERHPDCPLLELPPHGDLISRDDLLHTMRCHLALYDSCPEDLSLADKSRRDEIQNAIADIFNAPVVVPAERSDEDA